MRIDHITLLVTSLDTSMRYYEALLPLIGFTKRDDHVWTDGDGVCLQFGEARPGTSRYERYGAGMNHVGFAARSADEVASVRAAMQQAGFDVPELQHFGDVTALFMRDPDGIRFEVTYCPPGVPPV
ncbi:VOC family protein [Cognatilysobacter bugurensis]|uniref:VOC domain-containing protein n=1 Tax=Cognatilysobacter bugurensis TaxID=543356 RepID=A0A918T143_9GAMM|nr:VOC family protein [Lysobacter bugurensis]GHA83076.1 hypothetical protein GCM10007067_21480 [Lysobacter bugurensis]